MPGLWEQAPGKAKAWLQLLTAGLEMAPEPVWDLCPFLQRGVPLAISSPEGEGTPSLLRHRSDDSDSGSWGTDSAPLALCTVCPSSAWGQWHLNALLRQGSEGQGLGAVVFTTAI